MSNSYYEIVPIVNRWIQKRAKFELQTEEKRLLSSWLGRDSTLFFEQLDSSTLKSRLSTPREGSLFHQPRIKLNILQERISPSQFLYGTAILRVGLDRLWGHVAKRDSPFLPLVRIEKFY